MKIIPFFPDDPVDTGIFCKCVRYMVAAYFRIIPTFEFFFHYTFGVDNSSNIYLNICQKKNQSYIRFWSRDNHVIIGTYFTGFESALIAFLAADVLTQFYLRSTFTRRIQITRAAESCL